MIYSGSTENIGVDLVRTTPMRSISSGPSEPYDRSPGRVEWACATTVGHAVFS